MKTAVYHNEGFIAYSMGGGKYANTAIVDMSDDAYLRGRKDGAKEMEIELIKRGNALYQLAFKKVEEITAMLVEAAKKYDIKIYEFHLKVENWDCLKSVLLVDMEDFIDEKIENLYRTANEISDKVNDDSFHWDYSITFSSEEFNKDKIMSDGFTHFYEHISRTRQAQ